MLLSSVILGKIFACLTIFTAVHGGQMHLHPIPDRFITASVVLNILITTLTVDMGIFSAIFGNKCLIYEGQHSFV